MNAGSGLNSGRDPRHQPSPGYYESQAGRPDTAPPVPSQPGWCLCGKDFKSNCQTPGQKKQRRLATMHSFQSLLLPMLLLLLATTGPTDALSEEDKKVLVDQHNLYRSQVFPKSTHMLKMYWDEDLAKFAEAYARHCQWAHNPNRGWRGENLFAMTGSSIDLPLGVSEWHSEHNVYNFTANTCKPGKVCGHYTQVVWADSNRVGCGTYFCEKLHVLNEVNVYLLVCNYHPPGNMRGRWPYRVGPSCSQCPSDYRCVNSLCEPIRGPEEAQDLPSLVTEASSSLATEASGARKKDTPSSLATEAPSFLVTEVPTSLATKALPTLEIEAPSSLPRKDPPSMATEAPSLLTTEVPSSLTIYSMLSFDQGPVNIPKSIHTHTPKFVDKVASRTKAPSVSPERSLHPEMPLTGIQEPLPRAQEKAQARGSHKLPSSGEVLASVFPAQDEPDELQATRVHMGHTTSRSLPRSPNISATTNAMGGHTLTLQSSLPDETIPEEPGIDLGIKPVMEPSIGAGIQPGMGKPDKGRPSNIKLTTIMPTMEKPAVVKTIKTTTLRPTTEKPTRVKTTTVKTTMVKPNKLKPNKLNPSKVKPAKVKPSKLRPNSAPSHVWSTFLGLLLLPPLILAGNF
ncbi:peptidase inhibitor 16-like isoform X1 [Tamandua tetradactyla]|uniref:peptidase inhibitor 16-like isoform X1 n=1 Tax=Tamandua tetradactyla TaxID=48850 RepID=UPI004053D84C